jgi:hypothetical protein
MSMSRKLQWHKKRASAYLADVRIRQLTWAQKGIAEVLYCLMRDQMDEPGRAILNGQVLDEGLLCNLLRPVCTAAGGNKRLSSNLRAILQSGLMSRDEHGVIICKQILNDVDTSTVNRRGGIARATNISSKNGDRDGDRDGDRIRDRDREREQTVTVPVPEYPPALPPRPTRPTINELRALRHKKNSEGPTDETDPQA